ncbi:MAG: RtcB family protein [Candidatus Margulisbacteria bacterium]|nr:RtcB family protein [Candidatus Margulisiibacteriota bacterium]
MAGWETLFQKIDDYRWLIPRSFMKEMKGDGLLYAAEPMLPLIYEEKAHVQVANVACLPGLVGKSLAMPDIHLGYGFAIGGVAAFDPDAGGVISPGGVGYDINCGVRVLRTDLHKDEVRKKINDIVNELAREVPSGVGSTGALSLSEKELDKVLSQGAKWAVKNGYGTQDDILHTEENGSLPGADPSAVSSHAKERGKDQVGTLGSGNHFLEIQYVEEIYDEKAANTFGLYKDQVTIMVHTGSRGLGHQVCSDYINILHGAVSKYKIYLPDRQLVCAPVNSPEGRQYFSAMCAAANFAWCNRQLIMHWTRESFAKAMGSSPAKLGISLIYDVCHNVAKMEMHGGQGPGAGDQVKKLCVHRKGATRAFPAGHPEIPKDYAGVGQPVLVPGDMGRYSYIMVGTELAMKETWGSVCHGAGRSMSRSAALRKYSYQQLIDDLDKQGIVARSASKKGLVEEAPGAYKDVREVVDVVHNSGLARKVARLRPLAVVKG